MGRCLNTMFEDWARYDHILVTGPQRSGTTIAATMIAHDTGHALIREEVLGIRDIDALWMLLSEPRLVVQCPAMCCYIDQYGAEDALIVMMVRDLDAIRASEERIHWGHAAEGELRRYGMPREQARTYWYDGGQVAPIKYERWREQRLNIPHWVELEYESLAAHPLWIPQAERAGFGARQVAR